jgi:hypothetical protein
MTRTGQVNRNKFSMERYCITIDTQPSGAAEYGSSSLMGTMQGMPIDDSGGT